MKITIDKNVVEFVPENTGETNSMETLWRILINYQIEIPHPALN